MLRRCAKYLKYLFAAFLVVEVLVFNFAVFYGYMVIRNSLESFQNTHGGIIQKFSANRALRRALESAKQGGLSQLLEETVERLYLVTPPKEAQGGGIPRLTFLGIDMSNAGEMSCIYRRIQTRKSFPYKRLVVDIGANDGLISSNSFNLIQLGWNAILVEPVPSQMELARRNTYRHYDPYTMRQNITYVQAVLGTRDGIVDFAITDDLGTMENHVVGAGFVANKDSDIVIQVKSYTVASFASIHNIPINFGVLSIDAEGMGDKILRQWIRLGFRPAYIIYEAMHNVESVSITATYLHKAGYVFIAKRGWNYIFEMSSS